MKRRKCVFGDGSDGDVVRVIPMVLLELMLVVVVVMVVGGCFEAEIETSRMNSYDCGDGAGEWLRQKR